MMKNFIVTTGRKSNADAEILAAEVASKLNLKFIPRGNFSLDYLKKIHGAENILVAKNNSLTLVTGSGELFFHPNIAHLRIKNLRRSECDRLVEAAHLKAGMKILDCTLGLGADAIVESFVVGASGKVIALEINPVLAEIVRRGLKNFSAENETILSAMRRVEVITADYRDYLKTCAENSFDVVYFDPMFTHALEKSSGINPIRPIANHEPLTLDSVREACRVAKNFVVLKNNSQSAEFARLGFEVAAGGKYSSVAFGTISNA